MSRFARLAILVGFAFVILANRQLRAERTHDITIDDYFTQAFILDHKISPSGEFVAYVEARWRESTNDRKTDLWIVGTRSREARRLTFDRANDRSPRWSADSKHIYFLGNRKASSDKSPPYDGKTQVWRIPVSGGIPQPVTRLKSGVGMFEVSADGRSLYYLTERESTTDDWKDLRSTFKEIEYGHGVVKVSVLWRLDLQTWRTEKLIDEARVIGEFAVSPDGQRVAMITTSDGSVLTSEGHSRVDVYDVGTEEITIVPDGPFRSEAPSPYGWLGHLAWAGDGKKLSFNVIFDAYPSEVVVAEFTAPAWQSYLIPRPQSVSLHGYGSPLAWRGAKSELCFLGDDKGRVRLYCAKGVAKGRVPEFEVVTPGDVVVSSFSFDSAGRLGGAVVSSPSCTRDVHLLAEGEGLQRLTSVNAHMETWRLPQISTVTWKACDGASVEGILELPPDYPKNGPRLPLEVVIHGGPTTSSHLHLQYWTYGRTLLAAKGYAVLCPNYRGSTGYGDRFLTDLIGRTNDIDVADILAGVDSLIERGIADPQRLAVMGWSNGGYLTNCIISRTNRFKAAISGAGIVDTVMQFGSNDEPAYMLAFHQGYPWAKPEIYHRTSSTYQLDKIRTPTLIHVGANDVRCPPSQSRMLYRSLRHYVDVPTELLIYPDDGHTLSSYQNRLAKMKWDISWLDRHLKATK